MSDGPYRNNLESRVSNLEQEVETLKGSAVDKGPSVKKAFKGQIVTLLNDGSLAGGSFIAILLAIVCFSFPSCVRSCNADNAQAREALVHQREEACEALGLRYAEYWDDPNASRNDYIICVGTDRVVYISPADPTRSYSRTIEQLNSATIPSE